MFLVMTQRLTIKLKGVSLVVSQQNFSPLARDSLITFVQCQY